MKIFISGGCKNGKSYYAQRLAEAQRVAQRVAQQADSPCYIATMKPVDAEDNERIARHRREREGWGFTTVEQPVDIEKILDKCDHNSSFLLDSLTALLANEMFLPDGSVNDNAHNKIADGLRRITQAIDNIVIVSDFIYSDALLYDRLTEKYRESLSKIDKTAATHSDVVLEVVYGNVIIHKGKDVFGKLYEKIS
ncbi:MAG: bifunctional adenosylcobinamide kinase/adenosylcobinamide-phosphate guanylyltransferase [Treponema sp.]|jgi:adenosylcobinamide kinase/adenosylcobinamide-phosphate guanylyltransferase|nr:bifunctional adenosylcobinamide kinase/adenosylcobinamide-phosphate guanylyltransferase [Treponema sp.]